MPRRRAWAMRRRLSGERWLRASHTRPSSTDPSNRCALEIGLTGLDEIEIADAHDLILTDKMWVEL